MAVRRWRVLVDGVEVARSWSEAAAMDQAMEHLVVLDCCPEVGRTVTVVFPNGDRVDLTRSDAAAVDGAGGPS